MGPSSGSSRPGSSQRPCGPPPTAFFGTKALECNTAPPLPMPSSPIFRPSSSLPCSAAQNYRPASRPSSEPALHCSYHLAAFQPTSMQPRRRTRSALPRISISRTSSTRMNAASKQSFPVIPSAGRTVANGSPSPTARVLAGQQRTAACVWHPEGPQAAPAEHGARSGDPTEQVGRGDSLPHMGP